MILHERVPDPRRALPILIELEGGEGVQRDVELSADDGKLALEVVGKLWRVGRLVGDEEDGVAATGRREKVRKGEKGRTASNEPSLVRFPQLGEDSFAS
jgi:hypothetical protein